MLKKKNSPSYLVNSQGKIDPSIPFPIFGPLPMKNTYLTIGHLALLNSNITFLEIKVHWFNLPLDFSYYYKEWESKYQLDNLSFKVNFSIYLDKNFRLCHEHPVSLFREDTITGYVSPTSVFILNTKEALITKNDIIGRTKKSAVTMWLSEPDIAFGHEVYTGLFGNIAMFNARRNTNLPLPNPPFVPIAKQITIRIK